MKIVVLCVNYHNQDEVIQYVKEIKKQTVNYLIDVVITNNSDNTEEFNNLKEALDADVYVYHANMNLGYIHGINFGLKNYLETHDLPEWMVVSNTDLTYENDAFYQQLVHLYPNGYDCVIAPSIYSEASGFNQNPFVMSRYSKLKMFILAYVFRYSLLERGFNCLHLLKQKLIKRKQETIKSQEIYSGHGACLILNKMYFLKGGDLNYGSFLFGEEIYIAEMVRKLGGHIYYDKRLKVNHHEHTTINKEKRKTINKFYFDSLSYLFKTFY